MQILKYLDKPIKVFGISYSVLMAMVILAIFCLFTKKMKLFIFCVIAYIFIEQFLKQKLGLRGGLEGLFKIVTNLKYHPRGLKKMFIR